MRDDLLLEQPITETLAIHSHLCVLIRVKTFTKLLQIIESLDSLLQERRANELSSESEFLLISESVYLSAFLS